jgi:hypothetical protein
MTEQTAGQNGDGVERVLGPGAKEAVDGDLTASAAPEVDEELQLQTLEVDGERRTAQDADVVQGSGAQTAQPAQQQSRQTVTTQTPPSGAGNTEESNNG